MAWSDRLSFGRSKAAGDLPPTHQEKDGGKGRPTPSRREAEAARKERLKAGTKATRAKLTKEQRAAQNAKVREGMRSGDERYIPQRDKGPVKRFIRDWVDVRLSFMEFLLPVLFLLIVLGFFPATRVLASQLQTFLILLLLADIVIVMIRLGPELKRRFGDSDESLKGWRFYAIMRSIQLRPLRIPKPQRKWREKLPDRY